MVFRGIVNEFTNLVAGLTNIEGVKQVHITIPEEGSALHWRVDDYNGFELVSNDMTDWAMKIRDAAGLSGYTTGAPMVVASIDAGDISGQLLSAE